MFDSFIGFSDFDDNLFRLWRRFIRCCGSGLGFTFISQIGLISPESVVELD